ncbi:hypothetical protein LZ31DRAFT_329958 [Colletotrichum somersetense]|nr:hypothetical protein LZ31DRAFT_329958 [Colletotrichum somersetense]
MYEGAHGTSNGPQQHWQQRLCHQLFSHLHRLTVLAHQSRPYQRGRREPLLSSSPWTTARYSTQLVVRAFHPVVVGARSCHISKGTYPGYAIRFTWSEPYAEFRRAYVLGTRPGNMDGLLATAPTKHTFRQTYTSMDTHDRSYPPFLCVTL